ncbi:MAG: LysR family transcriptional regulator [Bdellovibrionales bacterium]
MVVENLYWELSVLTRATAFSNLSIASRHVGLSQPQLSRIVKRIEEELEVNLLNREAKRKSSWTPAALRLTETFSRSARLLNNEIESTVSNSQVTEIKIATLEGLGNIAQNLGHELLEEEGFELVELDVHDLSDLEELFLRGNYDMIFTFREPTNRKFRYETRLGYQTMKHMNPSQKLKVMSQYEFRTARHKKKKGEKHFVSNSLLMRKEWLDHFGGSGLVPSSIHEEPIKEMRDQEVLVIGSDLLNQKVWNRALRVFQRFIKS